MRQETSSTLGFQSRIICRGWVSQRHKSTTESITRDGGDEGDLKGIHDELRCPKMSLGIGILYRLLFLVVIVNESDSIKETKFLMGTTQMNKIHDNSIGTNLY